MVGADIQRQIISSILTHLHGDVMSNWSLGPQNFAITHTHKQPHFKSLRTVSILLNVILIFYNPWPQESSLLQLWDSEVHLCGTHTEPNALSVLCARHKKKRLYRPNTQSAPQPCKAGILSPISPCGREEIKPTCLTSELHGALVQLHLLAGKLCALSS